MTAAMGDPAHILHKFETVPIDADRRLSDDRVGEECVSPFFRRLTPVRTTTCRDLGGSCDQKLTAETWVEMVRTMTKHVLDKHPDVAKRMEKMHNEDPTRWGREHRPK
jgi:hypothetical protein